MRITQARQLKLFAPKSLGHTDHGGDIARGRRKTARPFSPNAAIHLVLKSSRARGGWSLLHRRNRSVIERTLHAQAERAGVRIYRSANVGSHIHLLIKAPRREALQKFLRALGGLIARHVTRAKKGAKLEGKFWDRTAYSRLIHWGREFRALCAYLAKNRLESCGFGGAKLRFTPAGEAVIVVGDADFRPGRESAPQKQNPSSCHDNYELAKTEAHA